MSAEKINRQPNGNQEQRHECDDAQGVRAFAKKQHIDHSRPADERERKIERGRDDAVLNVAARYLARRAALISFGICLASDIAAKRDKVARFADIDNVRVLDRFCACPKLALTILTTRFLWVLDGRRLLAVGVIAMKATMNFFAA